MQRVTILFIALCLLVISSGFLSSSNWKLRKDDEGIKVFTRPIAGSSLDEFKGVAVIDAPLTSVVEVLKDADNLKEWSPNCKESKLLSLKGSTQIQYTISHAPFPMDNRDSYVKLVYKQLGQNIKVEMSAIPNHKPRVEDFIRIEQMTGFWLLEPVREGTTKVTYQIHADPGGSIPDWLANSASVDTPFNTLSSLRDYIEKN